MKVSGGRASSALGTAAPEQATDPAPEVGEALFEPAVRQRPLELSSSEAKGSVALARRFLPPSDLSVKSVEQDGLGMTHVRFERRHRGLPVFGEQLIVHLKGDGSLSSVTGTAQPIAMSLTTESPRLGEQEAAAEALHRFNEPSDAPPAVEKVVVRSEDGYRLAYRVECMSFGSSQGPRRQNYLIDAESGRTLREWNELQRFATGHASGQRVVERRFEPNAPIAQQRELGFTFTVDQDFRAGEIALDLDIEHANRGDLVVKLTSPSGKSVFIADRQDGFGTRDLKGSYDLYGIFNRDPVKGEWKLTVEDGAEGDTGVLRSWGMRIAEGDPRPSPRASTGQNDQSVYTGLVELGSTQRADGKYELLDRSRGQGVETRDANEGPGAATSKAITDDNDLWGEATDGPRQKSAVDAQYGAQTTYDYYQEVLGRDSIDGRGEKLVNLVHSGRAFNNAIWDGYQMHYGDRKDGSSITWLDAAGHEITHGLTQRTAGLQYFGESGGLNEAMSDIVGGAGVEWYALKKYPALAGKLHPYVMGDQLPGADNTMLRNFADPASDGDSIDHYKHLTPDTDVHFSSGIANHAFYLLTNGGTNKTSRVEVKDGIGIERGLRIFSRALIYYMTPATKFADARAATVQAATDLYGADSREVQRVNEAWTAVGVGT